MGIQSFISRGEISARTELSARHCYTYMCNSVDSYQKYGFKPEELEREYANMCATLGELGIPTGLTHGDIFLRNMVYDDIRGKPNRISVNQANCLGLSETYHHLHRAFNLLPKAIYV